MEEPTGFQLIERRERLETSAALILGRMQFEFARLDVALGLCAVWVDDGQRLKELTPRVEVMSFHKKLEFVDAAVERRLRKGSAMYLGYKAWLERADAARVLRNQLVHGRWSVDPMSNEVINVLGLPTSDGQREERYGLRELELSLEELRSLQSLLWQLREQQSP